MGPDSVPFFEFGPMPSSTQRLSLRSIGFYKHVNNALSLQENRGAGRSKKERGRLDFLVWDLPMLYTLFSNLILLLLWYVLVHQPMVIKINVGEFRTITSPVAANPLTSSFLRFCCYKTSFPIYSFYVHCSLAFSGLKLPLDLFPPLTSISRLDTGCRTECRCVCPTVVGCTKAAPN